MLEFAKPWVLLLLAVSLIFSERLRACIAPFFFALLLALAVRKPIARLEKHLPRWLASLIVLLLTGLLGLCVIALAAVQLWQAVPSLLEDIKPDTSLWDSLEQLARLLPDSLESKLLWLLDWLENKSADLTEQLTLRLTEWGTNVVKALPNTLFSFGVGLLATFYAASDWPRVRQGLLSLLPAKQRSRAPELLMRLKRGVMGWLKAQGVLMGTAFLILTAGFLLLRIPGAVLTALVIALADALPFLGTGLFLLPWAALSAFQGQCGQAIGLLGIWALVNVCRTILEPRLLGKQAGVSPLLTLFVMYSGWKLVGLPGLILGPILLSAVRSVQTDQNMAKKAL